MSSGMYETTVGSLSLRKLEYSYSNSQFTDTLIYQPTHSNSGSKSGSRSNSKSPKNSLEENRKKSNDGNISVSGRGRREELESENEDEFMSVDEEMDELSDSKSSIHTSSRPVTPSQQPIVIPRSNQPQQKRGKSSSPPPLQSGTSPEGVFTLAHKAVCILGLIPGTLGYAKACLENAKDEIKRLSELSQQQQQQISIDSSNENGMRNRIQNRARKAMSFTGFQNGGNGYYNSIANLDGHGKVPNVILGYGTDNKLEEERREKRRKAVDGVIYWQREIERLEKEEVGKGH